MKRFLLKKRTKIYPINFTDEFLFIHIPKNGGTSLLKSLGFKNATHIKAKEIIQTKRKDIFNGRFSFAVSRNPYDRFISLYNYARMDVSFYHNNITPLDSKNGMHLDYELLKNASIDECAKLLLKNKLKHDKAWNHWDPQYTWVYDRKLLVSKVYKLENLDELKNDFKEKFHIDLDIPIVNKSKDEGEVVLNTETKQIIAEYYRKDFEFFNYPI